METLKPVEVSEFYIKQIAKGMREYFWLTLFQPIFSILESRTIYNASSPLLNAINSGVVYYENGAFKSAKPFSNAVARELENLGARYRKGAYYIQRSLLPIEYEQAIALISMRNTAKLNSISDLLATLSGAVLEVTVKDFIQSAVEGAFKKLEVDLIKSAQEKQIPVIELDIVKPRVKLPKAQTKNLEKYWKEQDKKAEDLQKAIREAEKQGQETQELKDKLTELSQKAYENAPKIDIQIDDVTLDAQSKKIAEDYTYNMQYWVKKWEAKNIIKMREDVLKMIQEGARTDRIQEYFEKRWKIAGDKARFLAVNESHLASSVIKATRYQEMGCTQFRWDRSSSREKRELHKEYYGKVFKFSEPPIIDEKLGITGLPRQIWNCKCHMSPVVERPDFIRINNAKRTICEKITNSKQCDNNAWRYRRFG